MSARYLMGLDAGGRSGRCLLLEVDRGRTFIAVRPWSHPPVPDGGGWIFDLDLEALWSALAGAAQQALRAAGARPDEVAGVAVSSMRHTTIVLDAQGRPLLAAPNRDARAAGVAAELAAGRGPEFARRTGHWPAAPLSAGRLCWLAETDPALAAQAHTVLSLNEWIALRLCGQAAADPSQAAETMLFDLTRGEWAWDLIDSLGLPAAIFPRLAPAGACLGEMTAQAAAAFGLAPGTPVAVGGADTQCGLLGAGALAPGDLGVVAGSTTPLQLVTAAPSGDPPQHLWTGRHVVPDLFVLESNAGGMGESLEWIAALLYPEEAEALPRLDAEAAQAPPGAGGLLSSFGAQVFDASNLGLPFGYLSLSHLACGAGAARRAHVARAVLEGLAFAVRANAEQLAAAAGAAPRGIWVTGGMSRGETWTKILCAALGQPLSVTRPPEATARGAALCAGVGAGLFGSLAEAVAAIPLRADRLDPSAEAAAAYAEVYPEWQRFRGEQGQGGVAAGSLLLRGLMSEPPEAPPRAVPAFRPRILVTAEVDPAALARLQQLGEVDHRPYRETYSVLTGDELVEAAQGAQVLVTEVDVVDAEALARLPELRVVACCRGNPVNVDAAACGAFGVPLIRTPGRNADAVADLALAFMLMLARRLPAASQFLLDPEAEAGDLARMGAAHSSLRGSELWRKTIGLIGLGATGRAVARRARAFGARLLVHDPYVTAEQAAAAGAEAVSLERLLGESDFVSLHAAVTPATTGLLDAVAIARMKPGAFLINTARAALTDEQALAEALRAGRLAGAGLDVFSVEPPGPDHPLLRLPNVIATPHLGGNTAEVPAHQGEIVADELERLLRGERPRHLVDPAAFERFDWAAPRPTPSAEALAQLRSHAGPAISDLDVRREPSAGASIAPDPLAPPAAAQKASQPSMSAATPLESILRAFLSASEGDEALRAFAAGRRFSMHYSLTDAGLDFHMLFDDGAVRAGLGAPPGPPDLALKMKAEVFDGMMTGRIKAMSAAMSGKLKFSGDTAKAMQMQRVQKDIMRLYSAARAQVGDPGDLTAASAAAAPPPAPVAAAPPPAHAGAPQPAPAPDDERAELVAVVQELYEKNLITASGGNLSVRVAGRDDQLWITPSAMFKGSLTPDMMVRIDLDGEALEAEGGMPSSERLVHTEILKARPDLHVVVHTHAPWATLLALSETPFLPVSTEAAFVGELPRVPFIMPGTRELAEAVAGALGPQGVAALMQNHGLVVAGSSLRRAASTTEVIERYAELILRCLALGRQPPLLPDEIVRSLREMGQMMA